MQGIAFVLFVAGTLLVPAPRRWPWVWLTPAAAYTLLVACVRPIRYSLGWLSLGRLSVASVATTIGIMAFTTAALLLFHSAAHPEVQGYRAFLPISALGSDIAGAAVFAIVNGILEELVFRGVLFDAVQSQRGNWGALIGTAILFGLGHLHGYPPGVLGACLAGMFGAVLGALRLWTGGLLLPIAAHISADATIYGILVHSARV